MKIKQELIDVDALEDQVSDFRPGPITSHDSIGLGNHVSQRIKFEKVLEASNLITFSDSNQTHSSQTTHSADDGPSDEEQRENELRHEQLRREIEVDNGRARQVLARLVSQANGNVV